MGSRLTMFPGHLGLAVIPMRKENGADFVYQSTLGSALYDTVAHEAMTHGAAFNGSRFYKILDAVKENKIQAWFIVAQWATCLPRVLGAAVEFPTVLTKWNGKEFKHYPAIYGEDTCIPNSRIRGLIREKPRSCFLSDEVKIGDFLQEQRIMQMLKDGDPMFGMTPKGRVAEYAIRSAAMTKILNGYGAALDDNQKCPVLQVENLTPAMKNRWQFQVSVEGLASDKAGLNPSHSIFVANWDNKIAASFTEAISTFTGDPIVRVQLTSNGSVPKQEILKDVLSSLLVAGHNEISERRWGMTGNRPITQSPLISIDGSQQEVLNGLLSLNKVIVLRPRHRVKDLGPVFGHKVPTMRIHAPNEPEMVAALQSLGAQVRMLGPHPMYPATMDFKDTHIEGLTMPPSKPLNTVNLSNTTAPMFALVA